MGKPEFLCEFHILGEMTKNSSVRSCCSSVPDIAKAAFEPAPAAIDVDFQTRGADRVVERLKDFQSLMATSGEKPQIRAHIPLLSESIPCRRFVPTNDGSRDVLAGRGVSLFLILV